MDLVYHTQSHTEVDEFLAIVRNISPGISGVLKDLSAFIPNIESAVPGQVSSICATFEHLTLHELHTVLIQYPVPKAGYVNGNKAD